MSVFDSFQQLFGVQADAGPTVSNYLRQPTGIVNATHPIDGNLPSASAAPPAPPSPGTGNPGVLAQLPSALRAKATAEPSDSVGLGGGGFGEALAAGADAGKGRSAMGAFGAGFAKGLAASSAYDDKQSDKARQAGKDQIEAFKTLFGIQHQQDADTETGRHNLATETNAATNTSNLGKYYQGLIDDKAKDKDPALDKPINNANAQRIVEGLNPDYKPGTPDFEARPFAERQALRNLFVAKYKGAFNKDPDPAMAPEVSEAPLTETPHDTRSIWESVAPGFLGGKPAPGTPANPAKDPAHPTVTTDVPPPRPPVRNVPIAPPAPPVADPAAAAAPPAAPTPPGTPNGLPFDPGVAKAQAKAAIAAGADPAAVKARMQTLGIDTSDF